MSEIVHQNPLLRFSELYKESNTPHQKARTKPLKSPSADRFTPNGTNSRNPLLLTVPTPLESQRPRNPLEGYNFNTSLKPETGKTNSPKSSTPTQPVSPLSPSTPKQPEKEGVKVDIDAATSATGTLSGSLTPVSTGAAADNGGDSNTASDTLGGLGGIAGTLGSVISALPSAKAASISHEQANRAHALAEKNLPPGGLPPLGNFDNSVAGFIADPKQSIKNKVLHVVGFSADKMDSRVKRLGIETTGQVVAGAGAAIAVLGSVVPGIGNAIGAGTAAAGTGLGLLPRAYAGVRAVYKNISDTKGVDRGAGAELLWGLAISKGIRDRKIVETSLEGPAKTAYDKATQGATSDDLKNGERLASEFLEITGIYDPKLNGEGNTLKADDLLLKSAGYQKIFDAMRSTTDAK